MTDLGFVHLIGNKRDQDHFHLLRNTRSYDPISHTT